MCFLDPINRHGTVLAYGPFRITEVLLHLCASNLARPSLRRTGVPNVSFGVYPYELRQEQLD